MDQPPRSLRPRHSVDYVARNAVSQTPGWLKRPESKLLVDPATATKENQRPEKEQTQRAVRKPTKFKQGHLFEPAGKPSASSPSTRHRTKPDQNQGPTSSKEAHSDTSRRSRSSRSTGAARSAEGTQAVADTVAQAQSSPDQQPEAPELDHPRRRTRVSYPAVVHAAPEQKQGKKRKAKGAPINNRGRKAIRPARADDAAVQRPETDGQEPDEAPAAQESQQPELQGPDYQEQLDSAQLASDPVPQLEQAPSASQQTYAATAAPVPVPQQAVAPSDNFLKLQVG